MFSLTNHAHTMPGDDTRPIGMTEDKTENPAMDVLRERLREQVQRKSQIEDNQRSDSAALTWTKETPSQEGWYWYREEGGLKKPCRIRTSYSFYHPDRLYAQIKYRGRYYRYADEAPGEWAGPIPEPDDT